MLCWSLLKCIDLPTVTERLQEVFSFLCVNWNSSFDKLLKLFCSFSLCSCWVLTITFQCNLNNPQNMTPAATRGGYAREALWFPLETLQSSLVLYGNIKYYPIFSFEWQELHEAKTPIVSLRRKRKNLHEV